MAARRALLAADESLSGGTCDASLVSLICFEAARLVLA